MLATFMLTAPTAQTRMASASDLEFTYSQIDRLFRLSIGEHGDFSGAKYDGDFAMSLEAAQRRKHEYIAESVGLAPGSRILDLGCGWGPFLDFARQRDAVGLGVTLSSAQAAACRRNGLDARVHDCLEVGRETFGPFDAMVSVGAFEHFCSPQAYLAGWQEAIYRRFFESLRGIVPAGGRFFLQTMVFGRNMIPVSEISADAPHLSDAHVLSLMTSQFPGSWLPSGKDQIVAAAVPQFRLVSASSGRLDYIETIRQWRLRFRRFGFRKLGVKLSLLPRWATNREFRRAFTSGISPNSICFERELMDHFRLVFEAV